MFVRCAWCVAGLTFGTCRSGHDRKAISRPQGRRGFGFRVRQGSLAKEEARKQKLLRVTLCGEDLLPVRPRPSPSRNRVLRGIRRRKHEAYTGSTRAVY